MSDHRPRVAAVIVSYNTRDLTLAAVDSIRTSREVEPEVWVVDNASADGSADAVRSRFPDVHVMELPANVGFGRANNVALSEVTAPYVLLLNSDAAFASADGLADLVSFLEGHADVGVVGPRLEGPRGRLEYSARAFPSAVQEIGRRTGLHVLFAEGTRERVLGAEFRDHSREGPADWLTGACLLVRREVLSAVGGFDPAFFLFGEELDWCWRVRRAGWNIVFVPRVVVIHLGGASGGRQHFWKLRMAMAGDAYTVRKHRGSLYFVLFFLARSAGLLVEAALQGLLGIGTMKTGRRRRAVHALRSLGAWLSALGRGALNEPGGPRFRPGAP